MFTLLMIFMMSSLVPFAMDGESTEEDFDETEYAMSIDSTQQTIAQGALGLGVIGVMVFLTTPFKNVQRCYVAINENGLLWVAWVEWAA